MTDPATTAPATPILPRDRAALPVELDLGTSLPEGLDPLADGILMLHQKEWLEDRSDLKVAEKGRRTGITFAEALDDTLIAAAKRSAGGDNVFYIGDTKEKGREFIGYVASFAKAVVGELLAIEEFLFRDERPDGTSKDITAYRVTFKSGFRVQALSSNPANIRGLQGIVVIDEAAFHRDVREVIDAVNALLIWGGKVRVISTHNGHLNPFNELIREALAGKTPLKVHHIPFSKAVENGLYRRVCLLKGRTWTQEDQDAWEANIRAAYGARTAAMRQELDAIPAEMEGAALTRVQIEAVMEQDRPFLRWTAPDSLKNADEAARKAVAADWCRRNLDPVLAKLDPGLLHFMGEDFARSGDASDIVIFEQGVDLDRVDRQRDRSRPRLAHPRHLQNECARQLRRWPLGTAAEFPVLDLPSRRIAGTAPAPSGAGPGGGAPRTSLVADALSTQRLGVQLLCHRGAIGGGGTSARRRSRQGAAR